MIDPTQPLIFDAVTEPEKQQENSKRAATPASWKPGQSGNPNGRPPKGYAISDVWKDMFNNSPEKKKQLAESILKAALNNDMQAAKLIMQYLEGMPQQNIDLNGKIETLTIKRAATKKQITPNE